MSKSKNTTLPKTPPKNSPDKHPGGRPSDYSEEMAARICDLVSTHTCGLPRLCDMYDDIPSKATINLWRYKNPEFSAKYALAKLKQAELLAEECLEISDDASRDRRTNEKGFEEQNHEFVARSRLRIDTRKWLASKLLPRQYGEAAKTPEEKKALVAELLDKLIE